jgi:hypothetical protein
MSGRAILEAFRELNEERKNKPDRSNTPSPTASPKLTAEFLRAASKLATEWAEADARLMLARKARQVAELDRRQGLRLVYSRDRGIVE